MKIVATIKRKIPEIIRKVPIEIIELKVIEIEGIFFDVSNTNI